MADWSVEDHDAFLQLLDEASRSRASPSETWSTISAKLNKSQEELQGHAFQYFLTLQQATLAVVEGEGGVPELRMDPPLSLPPPSTPWTPSSDAKFESLLLKYPPACETRWEKIALELGDSKTADDVRNHYGELVRDICEIELGGVGR
ncbi:hypothetical protein TrCOL_g6071 [Triparma columacea]|uniref:Myb-like domain-containing protein n=1 Tax=Triparma columacea TaxID=722753 RepID=A0A9W7G5N9_9STRA|nr:hypothetical protein TrCOL_g6071 [Triparma columacea]